jgi:hypothetical protein
MSEPTLLDVLVDIAAKDEAFTKAAMEHEKFAALHASPAWVALEGHIKDVTEGLVQRIAAFILKSDKPVDQRDLDRLRGYVEGMRAVAALPSKIDGAFDKQVERAWRRALAQAAGSGDHEQEDDQHGISP